MSSYTGKDINFYRILERIGIDTPLLLFPLRLETHYRERNKGRRCKELCIRIFPDEIMHDYYNEALTPQEVADGKYFWIQWFIASADHKREYEAWQVLCSKYSLEKASWICRMCRPYNLEDYLGRRPYPKMPAIKKACNSIISCLGKTLLDENSCINAEGRFKNEEDVEKYLALIDSNLSVIENGLRNAEFIVDYLYDQVMMVIEYLSTRLYYFRQFYARFESLYEGNLRVMDIWDTDYMELKSMSVRVERIGRQFEGKRISLEEMVGKYLEDKKNKVFFPTIRINESGRPKLPTASIFPEQFVFFGETKGNASEPSKVLYAFSNPVKRNLVLGLAPGEGSSGFTMDKDKNLECNGSIAWMLDYDKALEAGMAITVPLENIDTEFNYIYVLGIKGKSTLDADSLSKLFQGHIYSHDGLTFLKPATPTNLVDGAAEPEEKQPEDLMKRRYEIEVEHCYAKDPGITDTDGLHISNLLGLNYYDCFARVDNYDNFSIRDASMAMGILWDQFITPNITTEDPKILELLDFIKGFVTEYVRARGTVPAFRIGDQPYGILPVTAYSQLRATISAEDKDMVNLMLVYDTIYELGLKFKAVRDSQVISPQKMKGDDAQKNYLKMVSQNARSLETKKRYMIDSPLLADRGAEGPQIIGMLDDSDFFRPTLISDAVTPLTEKSAIRTALCKEMPWLSEEQADSLIGEFIDLFSYRLDAWYTGVICSLIKTRKARKSIVPAIGAYGWVFNLSRNARSVREDSSTIVEDMKLPSGTEILEHSGKDKGEYVMAPSIQHALTAAVLRSAYTNTMSHNGDSHMCINLSSARARQALRMLENVKNGMSTGIILGSDLERYLHEAQSRYGVEMDAYIYPLRKFFPQSIDIEALDRRASNHTMEVINGEVLLNSFMDRWNYGNNDDKIGRISLWLEKNSDSLEWLKELKEDKLLNDKRKLKVLFLMIERMQDSYDALNDLLLGEGVFRLVASDRESFGAISNFMSKGSGNVPDPAILSTPMEYVAVAHKVAVAVPQASSSPLAMLAMAEPGINEWVGTLLGSLENIVFYIDGENGICRSSLKEMDIDPEEYLYISDHTDVLKNLLEIKWRSKKGIYTGKLRILTGDPAETESGEILPLEDENIFTLYEDRTRISAIRALVCNSRAMKASDFAPGTESDGQVESSIDMEDLVARLKLAKDFLSSLKMSIDNLVNEALQMKELDDEILGRLYSLSVQCVESGMLNASIKYEPVLFLSSYDRICQRVEYDQAVAAQKTFIERISNLSAMIQSRLDESAGIALNGSESYCDAIRKLTLDSFRILPQFRISGIVSEVHRKDISLSMKKGISRYSNIKDIADWLEEAASVRSGLKQWNTLSMFEQIAGVNNNGVPFIYQEKASGSVSSEWLGAEVSQEAELDDADSLLVLNGKAFEHADCAMRGLVIDSWMEYIPYAKHTAGMAFRMDQPDAEAPQAILLATYPDFSINPQNSNWDFKHVTDILDSTRFMLMNRAVDPDIIYEDKELSKILPLLSDRKINLVSKEYNASSMSRAQMEKAFEYAFSASIFDYMPGGSILAQFLNMK